jgi:hypothetical protein
MGWTFNVTDETAADKGPMICSVVIALTSLALAIVSIRVYVRTVKVYALGSDDWVICATMVRGTTSVRKSNRLRCCENV